jgi:hypothetical protein
VQDRRLQWHRDLRRTELLVGRLLLRRSGSIPDISSGGSFTVSTCPAANNYTASCGGAAASADIVFRLTLTQRTYVIIDTVGSDFDAVLHMHRSNACDGSSATEVACDDNTGGGSPGQARISNSFSSGTYWVILDGAGAGSRGSYVLNVFTSPAPLNDECSGAVNISAGGSFSGSTIFAGDDILTSCTGLTAGAGDVYYTFTLSQESVVLLDTVDGGSWDTVLEVRSGSCTGAVTACRDNSCSTVRSQYYGILSAGAYYVIVDGSAPEERGAFTLFAQFVPTAPCMPPALQAMALNGGYTVNINGGGDNLTPSCQPSDREDVVYYIPACGPRSVTIDSCNTGGNLWDSVLYLRVGSCSAADAACAEDSPACSARTGRETLTVAIPKGLSFFIADAQRGAGGSTYLVNVSGL